MVQNPYDAHMLRPDEGRRSMAGEGLLHKQNIASAPLKGAEAMLRDGYIVLSGRQEDC